MRREAIARLALIVHEAAEQGDPKRLYSCIKKRRMSFG